MGDTPSEHLSAEEFRQAGYAVIDWLVDYRARVAELPVKPRVVPGAIRALLPTAAPEQGTSFAAIMADLDRVIMPGLMHWQSPNFFGYFPANTSPPSILGDLLSAGLGVQGMLWLTSPACTELESQVLDWLVDALGLPARFKTSSAGGGVIQDSASSATLCALLAARERISDYTVRQAGLQPGLVAYCSEETHSSLDKAVSIEVPASVILTVTDSPEGIRGDSANNVQKAAIVETGISVQVPLFIKTGEKIKIDTRTGKYMERA